MSSPKKTAMVYTMNCPEAWFPQVGYNELFQRYENMLKRFFGHCETLYATETLQVKDYSRYHIASVDGDARKVRHETVFPQDCQKAFELGVRLASKQ